MVIHKNYKSSCTTSCTQKFKLLKLQDVFLYILNHVALAKMKFFHFNHISSISEWITTDSIYGTIKAKIKTDYKRTTANYIVRKSRESFFMSCQGKL